MSNKTTSSSTSSQPLGNINDTEYLAYISEVQEHFRNIPSDEPIFQIDSQTRSRLWDIFLQNLPADQQQFHTCRTCQHFFSTYGGLVYVEKETGRLQSTLWSLDHKCLPDIYKASIAAVLSKIWSARINNPFYIEDKILGRPVTDVWTHFSLLVPDSRLFSDRTKTPYQASAERVQAYASVLEALSGWNPATLQQAYRILESDSLSRSEKSIGQVTFLITLKGIQQSKKPLSDTKRNLLWREIAKAPEGFLHPKAGVVGTLLDDIQANLPLETIRRKWDDKLDPLQYQRPQSLPSQQTVARAEKLVEQMGLSLSLERRYATFSDIADHTLWVPSSSRSQASEQKKGVFSSIETKEEKGLRQVLQSSYVLPETKMSWEVFSRKVLPEAEKIEYKLSSSPMPIAYLTTAMHPDAPPILQWDKSNARNPVSWYFYHGGTKLFQIGFSLASHVNHFRDVTAVFLKPSMWSSSPSSHHQGAGVMFAIEGASDLRAGTAGLGLFPETLISSLHEVRSVIEEFSQKNQLVIPDEPQIIGPMFSAGTDWPAVTSTFRVWKNGQAALYTLDRWE